MISMLLIFLNQINIFCANNFLICHHLMWGTNNDIFHKPQFSLQYLFCCYKLLGLLLLFTPTSVILVIDFLLKNIVLQSLLTQTFQYHFGKTAIFSLQGTSGRGGISCRQGDYWWWCLVASFSRAHPLYGTLCMCLSVCLSILKIAHVCLRKTSPFCAFLPLSPVVLYNSTIP